MSNEQVDVRSEVRAFLAEHWDADAHRPRAGGSTSDFIAKVFEAGWAAPSWPEQWWGRGLGKDDASAVISEFRKQRAPGAGQVRALGRMRGHGTGSSGSPIAAHSPTRARCA